MAYGLHKIQFGTASTLLVGHRDGWDLLVDNSHLTLKEAPRWALFGVQESVDPHLKTRLQALTNEDKCEHSAEGYRFSFEEYRGLGAEERTIFFGFCGWLPCSIQIHHHHSLGHPDFALEPRFRVGSRAVYPEFLGPLARLEGQFFLLPDDQWTLLDQIGALNSLPAGDKGVPERILPQWAQVAKTAALADAELDEYLGAEDVVVPEKVSIDVLEDSSGRTSIVPTFTGTDAAAMHRAYLRENTIQPVYSLETPTGRRTRVVLNEDVRSVLNGIRTYRRLSTRERDRLFSRPGEMFRDEVTASAIDLSLYGPRVKAIGEYPTTVRPFVGLRRDWTGLGKAQDTAGDDGNGNPDKAQIWLQLGSLDGESEEVALESPAEAEQLLGRLNEAIANQDPVVEFRGKRLPAAEELRTQLADCVRKLAEDSKPAPDKLSKPLVGPIPYENIDGHEYRDPARAVTPLPESVRLPNALKPEVQLKAHQQIGFLWLTDIVRNNSRGALLADDMGLGKTLQALAFIAWLVESDVLGTGLSRDTGPWDPILVVAPSILLEVWQKELREFFDDSPFLPYKIFDSSELRRIRKETAKEGNIGKSVLDLNQLRRHRLVISNYEAVANYGFSFGQVRWTAVVSDEAHEFKEPSTRVSHVMKALNTEFRLAMTGTPVVNRLLDAWNIVDFLRPLHLGSQKEFRNQFELKPEQGGITEGARRLRDYLNVASRPPIPSNAVILRRSKEEELPDLPSKVERVLSCPLSSDQRAKYLDLIGATKDQDGRGAMLVLLPRMNKLLQHPCLLSENFDRYEPTALKEQSPKLRLLLQELRNVRAKSEKALVFAISIDMQQILKKTLDAEFGLDVQIINGDSSVPGNSGRRRRIEKIEAFERKPGFDVMVLSPDVAGVGLTITAANHVFHYGRWWNSAREDQATDRVYRIGQTRDVYVYRLVAVDPKGEFKTFDEHLDDLIATRREAAQQFLTPTPSDEEVKSSIVEKLMAGASGLPKTQAGQWIDSKQTLENLSAGSFEGLVAAMWSAEGYQTYVTPSAADAGIDVVAISEDTVYCIHVRHVASFGTQVDEGVLGQVRNGASHYMANIFPKKLSARSLRLAVVTNGKSSRRLDSAAKRDDIQFIGADELLKRISRRPVAMTEVYQADIRRCTDLRELKAELQARYHDVGKKGL